MSVPELRDVLDDLGRRGVARSSLSGTDLETEIRMVTRRARRRRVARGSAVATGAVVAVLVGALAVQGVEWPRPIPPVDSPSPTVTQTPRPTPDVSPEPRPSATPQPTVVPTPEVREALGGVTVHPALPSALPLLEGMLEAATDDWRLVTFSPVEVPGAPQEAVVYLVSPDGLRYEVPTPLVLDGGDDNPDTSLGIESWLPGSTLAVALPWAGGSGDGGVQGYQVVDLLTGEVVGELPIPEQEWPSITFVGDGTTDLLVLDRAAIYDGGSRANGIRRLTADGQEVAAYGAFAYPEAMTGPDVMVVSPDRTRVMVSRSEGIEVLAADDLAVLGTVPLPDSDACAAWAWWDDSTALLACGTEAVQYTEAMSGTGPDALWAVAVDGGAPQLLSDDVALFSLLTVLDDEVILRGYSPTGSDPWTSVSRDGSMAPLGDHGLVSARIYGTDGSRLVLQAALDPATRMDSLLAVNPFTGEQVVLVPNPVGAGALRVAGGPW